MSVLLARESCTKLHHHHHKHTRHPVRVYGTNFIRSCQRDESSHAHGGPLGSLDDINTVRGESSSSDHSTPAERIARTACAKGNESVMHRSGLQSSLDEINTVRGESSSPAHSTPAERIAMTAYARKATNRVITPECHIVGLR